MNQKPNLKRLAALMFATTVLATAAFDPNRVEPKKIEFDPNNPDPDSVKLASDWDKKYVIEPPEEVVVSAHGVSGKQEEAKAVENTGEAEPEEKVLKEGVDYWDITDQSAYPSENEGPQGGTTPV
jgi:hypothetical protein